ncbi:MAG: GNAT family N-acetyltransferase [Lachnospiraceae bacterium]|nr:GNAT family N-acetyltransferase [Lachnospiraceae bacterium]
MVRMANRLYCRERKRLRKKTEEAKKCGRVSASLFLEGEMNALSDADCFFFYGSRLRPKGLLTVFFPDEEHAEITVAEFVPEGGGLPELYRSALKECKRVGTEAVHTVRNPVHGFDLKRVNGIVFSYEWSEYMLCIGMKELATAGAVRSSNVEGSIETEVIKEDAPEDDGTLRYVLLWNGQEAAECRILPGAEGMQCYLFGLKTKKELRRTGMATRLLVEIAKEYAVRDEAVMRLQVSSKNEPAERLYRKLGFVTEEEREYYKTEVSDG